MILIQNCHIILSMQITTLDIYKFCDYIPIVSGFTNGYVLCAKVVNFFKGATATPAAGSFQAYIAEKKVLRCIILILLPGIGNIGFAIYDLITRTDAPLPEQVKSVQEDVTKWHRQKTNSSSFLSITLGQAQAFAPSNSKLLNDVIFQTIDPYLTKQELVRVARI